MAKKNALEAELNRAARSIERRRAPVKKAGGGYSLVPVQSAHSIPIRGMPRPSQQNLLRAYAESPWLHIKIARLAAAFASLPFKIVAENAAGKDTELPKQHPFALLMKKPNPAMSGWDLRFLTELYIRSIGECYWRLKGSALGRELWVYPPNWVARIFGPNGQVSEYQVTETQPGGVNIIRVPAKQMIWLRSPDPLEPYSAGLGDALSLASEIDTFELASESDRRFFENDASPPGALVVPGRMSQEENDRMRDDFQRKQGGPENQGRPMLLWGGMDWKTFRAGRREMDYIDGQRYLRDVIIAGVHKHVLGITDDVNFAAAKAADYQVSKWELAPRIPWWQDNTDKVAILYDERLHAKWGSPVPQDETVALAKANEGLTRGAITRNEWRRVNEFDELPEEIGNVFIIPPGLIIVPADEGPRNAEPSPEKPPEARPEGGTPENRPPAEERGGNPKGEPAPETVTNPTVGAGRKKEPVFDPLHPNWRRVVERISSTVKTEDTMDVLKPIYEAVMQSRISDVKEELRLDVGIQLDDPALLHYLRSAAGERIRRVDENTRQYIRDELAEGIQAGENLRELEERLNTVFDIAREQRAERIARTETIDASNATAYASYQRSGVVEGVEWLLSPDYNGDEDDYECEAIEEAGPVRTGEEFVPAIAFPPAHPNCRCAIAPIVADDELAELVDAEAVVEDRMGAQAMVEDQKREAVEKEGAPMMPITSAEKIALTKAWKEDILPEFYRSRTALQEAARRHVPGPERNAAQDRILEKFFGQFAQVVYDDMQKWMPENVLHPLFKGLKITDRSGAFYHEGFISINREIALDKFQVMNAVLGAGQVTDYVELWQMQTIWHEVSHAMFDWAGNMTRFYDVGGKAFVEAINEMLGTQYTRTWLETVGIKVGEKTLDDFLFDAAAGSYAPYVRNWDRFLKGFGVNIRDERLAGRLYGSIVVDESIVPANAGAQAFKIGDYTPIRQFNLERIFGSIEDEIKASMSKEAQEVWTLKVGGKEAVRDEARRSWTVAANTLLQGRTVDAEDMTKLIKYVRDNVENTLKDPDVIQALRARR